MEKAKIFDNKYCAVCGQLFSPGIHCRRFGGFVCDKHCQKCEYFISDWHCMYLKSEVIKKEKAAHKRLSGGAMARQAKARLLEIWNERGEND